MPATIGRREQGIPAGSRGWLDRDQRPGRRHRGAARAFLAPGTRIYVSFLFRGIWQDAAERLPARAGGRIRAGAARAACAWSRIRGDAGSQPRRAGCGSAQVREVLLIAGDYAQAPGPIRASCQVMQSGLLAATVPQALGGRSSRRSSRGGPRMRSGRRSAIRPRWPRTQGIESPWSPRWCSSMNPSCNGHGTAGSRRACPHRRRPGRSGERGDPVAFRVRCGAGPSIGRWVCGRPRCWRSCSATAARKMTCVDWPRQRAAGPRHLTGIHLFCFGGFCAPVEWLHKVAGGRFRAERQRPLRRLTDSVKAMVAASVIAARILVVLSVAPRSAAGVRPAHRGRLDPRRTAEDGHARGLSRRWSTPARVPGASSPRRPARQPWSVRTRAGCTGAMASMRELDRHQRAGRRPASNSPPAAAT